MEAAGFVAKDVGGGRMEAVTCGERRNALPKSMALRRRLGGTEDIWLRYVGFEGCDGKGEEFFRRGGGGVNSLGKRGAGTSSTLLKSVACGTSLR